MSRRWIALFATATVIAMGTATPPASAGGQHSPLYGDLNGDGLTDRATLTDVPPEECGVVVELGRPGGGYELPEGHVYPVPGVEGLDSCPDLGTMLDLGGDGTVELVVGWFNGLPPQVEFDLLVLRDFQPSVGFTALDQPNFIGSADFNADKRRDIYQWSNDDRAFITLLNTADGRLVPGPLRFCGTRLVPKLADFDRDGAMDMVTPYTEGCDGSFSGVAVVLDDGGVVDLESHGPGDGYWTVQVVDANADGRRDVRTANTVTGEITHHLGDGVGGFTESPSAVADVLWLDRPRKTAIPVLANDAATTDARLEIIGSPRYGVAQVTSDRQIVYTPHPTNRATDRFVYRLTQDGKRSTTSVYVRFRG